MSLSLDAVLKCIDEVPVGDSTSNQLSGANNELVGLFSRPSDTNKKRIHVKLNGRLTQIFIRDHWGGESVVKKTLGGLWSAFGETTDVYYNDEYAYCFLSFSTHAKAKKVLDDLNDTQKVVAAAKSLIESQQNGQPQLVAKTILGHLVVNSTLTRTGARASWAYPKNNSHDDFDDREYYDDCPDREDRFVWNEYCAGRD